MNETAKQNEWLTIQQVADGRVAIDAVERYIRNVEYSTRPLW